MQSKEPISSEWSDLIPSPVDIDQPRWDQSEFWGRLNHFARITNPLLLLKSKREFEDAATLVKQAK